MFSKSDQDIFYQKLGMNIRFLRESENIKQEALANVLGLTRISISNIETGKQKIQLHALVEVANYLNVSVTDLIPSIDLIKGEISSKLEKKISNTEVSNNAVALEKIRDFIKLSHSNKSK